MYMTIAVIPAQSHLREQKARLYEVTKNGVMLMLWSCKQQMQPAWCLRPNEVPLKTIYAGCSCTVSAQSLQTSLYTGAHAHAMMHPQRSHTTANGTAVT